MDRDPPRYIAGQTPDCILLFRARLLPPKPRVPASFDPPPHPRVRHEPACILHVRASSLAFRIDRFTHSNLGRPWPRSCWWVSPGKPSAPRVLSHFPSVHFRPFSFATVGMFSAVSNLGAGGLQDVALSDTANGVLYGTFALTGLISGGINNRAFVCLRSPNHLPRTFLSFHRPLQFLDLAALSSLSVQVSSSAVNNAQANLGHSGLCPLCRCSLGVRDLP